MRRQRLSAGQRLGSLGRALRDALAEGIDRVGRPLRRWKLGLRSRLGASQAPATSAAPPEPRGLDLWLLAVVLGLLGLGMVMVYSASAVFAEARYHSAAFFLKRNLVFGAVGLCALYLGWRIDYHHYRRFIYPMLLVAFGLLAALLVPGLGTRIDGATRWFHLGGLSFQPSEPAKFALIAYLAYSLSRKQDSVRSFSIGFLPHLMVAGLMCLLILRQPDLGTAAVLGTVTLLLLLIAGTKLSYLVISVLAAAPILYQLIVGTPWRMRRLLAFLDPWSYRHDAGYQISESLISIGSGGLTGLGLGDGKQKLFFLPAAHTDFIFAIIGEELGWVGLLAVVGLFLIFLARGVRAALGARDLFGTYLAAGLTATYGLQAILHMSVVLGLVPTKGITLPMVSYGGSALASTLFCMGVLLNVAARQPAPVAATPERALPGNRRRVSRVQVTGREEGAPLEGSW